MLRPFHLLVVVIALGLPSSALPPAQTLEWKPSAPSPFARVESPAAVVGGYFYVIGGFTDDLGASNRVDVYDPSRDSWTRMKDMPVGLTHLNSVVVGETLWLAGGFKPKHPGPVTDEVWKYDIAADRWTPGPPLPAARAGGGLAVVDHKLHYFGGYLADRDTNTGDHWSLSLVGRKTWQREPDLPDPRGHLGAAALDGKIYALGGAHGHDAKQIDVSSCHRFDPATRQWTAIASLPDGRSHFESSTIVRRGRILIVGGRCNSSKPLRDVVSDMLEYDPHTDRWAVVGEMPEKLMAPAVGLISGRLVVTGGGLGNPRPLTAATRIAPAP